MLLLTAGWVDSRRLRIPNVISLGGAVAGLALWTVHAGLSGLLSSLGGLLVGAGIFLPFYLLKGMGAGDVKLMGAVGAFLGPYHALMAGITVAIFGGAIAAWESWQQGRLTAALVGAARILIGRLPPQKKLGTARREDVTPYGLAIAGGTLLYMVLMFTR